MTSKTASLNKKALLHNCPKFLDTTVQYEVIMGSTAYGVSGASSDQDIYGFAIPPRDQIFPHLNGYVHGFDESPEVFQQFMQHHIVDKSANAGKGIEYDLTIYSIAKYFKLLMECNPNIIDSLFVPRRCVVYSTAIGELVREQRNIFLHKGCWSTFKGYAYTQMHKMKTKEPVGKRKQVIEEFGYDVKFAYHVVRLLNEVEQILVEQNLELDRNSEQLKAIRRGEWTQEQVESYFFEKEKLLEKCYVESPLPAQANVDSAKQLLLNCLEQHYGNLHECVVRPDASSQALKDIQKILDKVKH